MENKTRLYEINARVWLGEQSWASQSPDLAAIPDAVLADWASLGFRWIWFMGVWEPSPRSIEICLRHEGLLRDFEAVLPGRIPQAVGGSPYSIRNYSLNPALGNEKTLARLRERLHAHGMKLMLDFVPNHMATDHPWVDAHPEFFVQGSDDDLAREPYAWFRNASGAIIANGRDPYFPAWTDVAQINYASAEARSAMMRQVRELANLCDGIRCDMAMLMTNQVFARTWGDALRRTGRADFVDRTHEHPEFWPGAIAETKRAHPGFLFMAEVYWDMEWRLQQMGFDYTYDKRLYDRLVHHDEAGLRAHVLAGGEDYERRLVRFIENHDEPRAAAVLGDRQREAAQLCEALPGMFLIHEGQMEGRRIKLPVQLTKRPAEPVDEALRTWYRSLLTGR